MKPNTTGAERRTGGAMAEGTQTTTKKKEGARSMTHFLNGLQHGRFAPRMSDDWHALLRELGDVANENTSVVKGKFTITIDVTMNALGEAQVAGAFKRACGKPKAASNNYYLTDGGNLSTEDPRQTELPLREVRQPRLRGETSEDEEDDDADAG